MGITHFREGLGNIDIYAPFHLVQISFYNGVIFANEKHGLKIKSLFIVCGVLPYVNERSINCGQLKIHNRFIGLKVSKGVFHCLFHWLNVFFKIFISQ